MSASGVSRRSPRSKTRSSLAVNAANDTGAIRKAKPQVRAVLARFLRSAGTNLAHDAATAYRRLRKDDADTVAAIVDQLGFQDWDSLSDSLKQHLIAVYQESGAEAVAAVLDRPLVAELFGALNQPAADYATARGAELVTQITDATRDGLRGLIEDAFTDGMSPADLAASIRGSYLFSPERADLIAQTELGMAHVSGTLEGWKQSGVVEGKSLILSNDHDQDDECNDAADLGVVPLDSDFDGLGDPPIHPRCECDVIPQVVAADEAD